MNQIKQPTMKKLFFFTPAGIIRIPRFRTCSTDANTNTNTNTNTGID